MQASSHPYDAAGLKALPIAAIVLRFGFLPCELP